MRLLLRGGRDDALHVHAACRDEFRREQLRALAHLLEFRALLIVERALFDIAVLDRHAHRMRDVSGEADSLLLGDPLGVELDPHAPTHRATDSQRRGITSLTQTRASAEPRAGKAVCLSGTN